MQRFHNWKVIVLIVAGIVIGLYVVVFLLVRSFQNNETALTPSSSPAPSPFVNNWTSKAVSNTTIEYPSDWSFAETSLQNGSSLLRIQPPGTQDENLKIDINITPSTQSAALADSQTNILLVAGYSLSSRRVGSVALRQMVYDPTADINKERKAAKEEIVFYPTDGMLYTFIMNYTGSELEVFDRYQGIFSQVIEKIIQSKN